MKKAKFWRDISGLSRKIRVESISKVSKSAFINTKKKCINRKRKKCLYLIGMHCELFESELVLVLQALELGLIALNALELIVVLDLQ